MSIKITVPASLFEIRVDPVDRNTCMAYFQGPLDQEIVLHMSCEAAMRLSWRTRYDMEITLNERKD